jgi:hypothetical protein
MEMEIGVADQFQMSGRDNRRGQARTRTRIRAWADPGGVAPVIDCLVVDVSKDGARIASLTGASLPDTFILTDDAKSEMGAANVKWRAGNEVGVMLDKRKSTPKN